MITFIEFLSEAASKIPQWELEVSPINGYLTMTVTLGGFKYVMISMNETRIDVYREDELIKYDDINEYKKGYTSARRKATMDVIPVTGNDYKTNYIATWRKFRNLASDMKQMFPDLRQNKTTIQTPTFSDFKKFLQANEQHFASPES